jgi:signal transduction histidine kinase
LSGKLKWAKTELELHIGELKDAKLRLERAQDELEVRIEERTRELSQTNKDLKSEIAQRIEAEKAILDISNREQQRLGQDLHDGLCQTLTGLRFMTQGLREALTEKDAPESKRMGVIESQLGNALAYVDTISRGLYPVELEVHGLTAALEELAVRTSKVFPVDCRFRCGGPVAVDDSAAANHLYRIAQESVINAIKSGKAKRINIRLRRAAGGSAVLSVADDGVGFGKGPMRRGMGVKMMDYRARVIGGAIAFDPLPGRGTLVKCSFPMRSGHGN